jgi:hypothetical protein
MLFPTEWTLLRALFTDVRIDYLLEGLTCEIDLLLGRDQSVARATRQLTKSEH